MNFKYVFKHPSRIILFLSSKGFFNFLNDKSYLKLKYKLLLNEKLDLNNPKTFNQKLQWLKLYDRKDIYTQMVDKFETKKYIENIIGEEYIIPTIGVYNEYSDIDFDSLPNQFVIKPTHTSGDVFVCKNKDIIDRGALKKKIQKWLKRNYFLLHREWPYKNVKRKIIIEKYMKDNTEDNLKDYKFFCFNGKVGTILVCSNRKDNFKNTDFFDENWDHMPFTRENHDNNSNEIPKPKQLEKMLSIAKTLSLGIPFVRVDLYDINDKIYFGELTFFPSAGFEGFRPKVYDEILGNMLELPNKIGENDESKYNN